MVEIIIMREENSDNKAALEEDSKLLPKLQF